MKKTKITIDKEFKNLVPPLTDQERQDLEAGIRADGCRDALVTWRGVLLDGHHRMEICEQLGVTYRIMDARGVQTRGDAVVWIVRNALARRNLTAAQKVELALRMEAPLRERAREAARKAQKEAGKKYGRGQPKKDRSKVNLPPTCQTKSVVVDDQLAASAGVSPKQVSKVRRVLASAPEKLKDQMRRGEVSIHAADKKVRKTEGKQQRAAEDAKAIKNLPLVADRWRVFRADIAKPKQWNSIADGSVDWIVSDPPYPKEFLPLYSAMSAFAARVLKPGGSLIAMVGQSYLPEVSARLAEKLEYHWTACYLTPGQKTPLWTRIYQAAWKPLLHFSKGKCSARKVGSDVFTSKGPDKDHHDWGQSESGMAAIVERVTKPCDLVCDPFLGAGTTGVVAVRLGRRFVGFDIEEKEVKRAAKRLGKEKDK